MSRAQHVLVEQKPLKGWREWVYRSTVTLAISIVRVFMFMRVSGTENLPRSGPVLVVSNHPSYLDPPTLVGISIYWGGRELSIMAWDKLFHIPFVAFFTRVYKAYPVDRENPGRGPYMTLLGILKKGGVAGVFPEGSRSHQRTMGPWKPGALRAAFATQATILPVSFLTVGEFWPRGHWRPRLFRKHLIQIHKPIPFAEYGKDIPDGPAGRAAQEILAESLRNTINGPVIERDQALRAHFEAASQRADPLRGREPPAERLQAEARERRVFRILGW
jgi:1-acyl-sn-glycerol-3-phosphate acyltransferase